ncbi:MAG: hypothetical protein QM740_14670 [Acidovorax sp.]
MNLVQKPSITQSLLLAAACLCTAASAFFGFLYYDLYWKYRDLFNEEGRYFDEQGLIVYHDDAAYFIVPTVVAFLLAFLLTAIWWARRRTIVIRSAGGA